MPVFEGLITQDAHGKTILDVLFILATWHAYAKLRLHTETTLGFFNRTTTALGKILRFFSRTTCQFFPTVELPREEAARGRRNAAKAQKRGGKRASAAKGKGRESTGQKLKFLNLCTYKLHALGDYVKTIWRFATSDNYSTQVGELEHRRVKRFYSRTNKFEFQQQITRHERRERLLRGIVIRNAETLGLPPPNSLKSRKVPTGIRFEDSEKLPFTLPSAHHHISELSRYPLNIYEFVTDHEGDPAVKVRQLLIDHGENSANVSHRTLYPSSRTI
jgi:hypothetical protein